MYNLNLIKKLPLLLVLVFGVNYCLIAQQTNVRNLLSHKEALEDIDSFFDTISNTHPDPYYYSSKKEFDSIQSYIKNNLKDSISPQMIKKLLEYHTNNILDAHTGITHYSYSLYSIPDENFVFPYDVRIKRNKFIVKDSAVNLGPLTKINGRNVSKIILKMKRLLKADFSTRVKQNYMEKYFTTFYHSLYGSSSTFKLSSQNKTVTIEGIKAKKIIESETTEKYRNFDFNTYPDARVCLLTINTFGYDYRDKFEKFLLKAFASISESGINDLIIDLRENSGGSDRIVNILLDQLFINDYKILYGYIKKDDYQYGHNWIRESYPKNIYKGNVMILQSNETGSAAKSFCSAIKTSERGLIIGQETRDPAFSFSNSECFELPNSRVSYCCATGFYAMPGSTYSGNNGIIPDIFYDVQELGKLGLNELKFLRDKAKEDYKAYFDKQYFRQKE